MGDIFYNFPRYEAFSLTFHFQTTKVTIALKEPDHILKWRFIFRGVREGEDISR